MTESLLSALGLESEVKVRVGVAPPGHLGMPSSLGVLTWLTLMTSFTLDTSVKTRLSKCSHMVRHQGPASTARDHGPAVTERGHSARDWEAGRFHGALSTDHRTQQ